MFPEELGDNLDGSYRAQCVKACAFDMGDLPRKPEQPDIGMPAVVGAGPQILILGSMPGERSLRARQYYAHPTNAFWPIMGELLGFSGAAPYRDRLRALKSGKVALWDVVHSCKRQGSLDSNIEKSSIVLNNLMGLLSKHSTLKAIAFNGRKANELFLRRIAPRLPADAPCIELLVLPSTSAAHASLSRENKLEVWRAILDFTG